MFAKVLISTHSKQTKNLMSILRIWPVKHIWNAYNIFWSRSFLSPSLFFMLLVGCVLKTQWYIISIYISFFALWNFKKFSRNKRTINKYNNKTIRTREQKKRQQQKKHTHVSTNLQSKKCYALWCLKCIL